VSIARGTDSTPLLADALLTLGRVLHRAGDRHEADVTMAGAITQYELKGDVVGAAAARRIAAELSLAEGT